MHARTFLAILSAFLTCAIVGWVAVAPSALGAPRAASSPQVMCPPAVGPDFDPYKLVPAGTPGCAVFTSTLAAESASSDTRTPVSPATSGPWRWIAKLEIMATNGIFGCTGYFVGPHNLFTAGHCLFGAEFGGTGYPISIRVIPGKDGSGEPYGSQYASGLHASAGWVAYGVPSEDYGLLTLPDDSLGNAVGWFTYGAPSGTYTNANLSGYPGDKPYGTQWRDHGDIVGYSPLFGTMSYDMYTYHGQSG